MQEVCERNIAKARDKKEKSASDNSSREAFIERVERFHTLSTYTVTDELCSYALLQPDETRVSHWYAHFALIAKSDLKEGDLISRRDLTLEGAIC